MAGLFDNSDPMQGGLMGMYANPNTAAMLGMAQGLLAASGPSRLPVTMGQALGSGMQGAEQGYGNALNMRMQMAKMQSQLDPFGVGFGGAGPSQQPNPTLAQGTPVSGSANAGPMSGLSAGLGSMAPQMPAQQTTTPSNGIALFGGHTPQEVMFAGARLAAFGNPAGAEMMKIAAQADPSLSPTDITKMGVQGGMTPEQIQQANRAGVVKSNYIAPTSVRGQFYADQNGIHSLPAPAPEGFQQVPDGQGGWRIVQQQGGPEAVASNASAKAGGQAQYQTQQVWDPSANNGQGGFVFQSTANIANSANGTAPNAPMGIRNNNPGNLRPGGNFAQYPDMQTGLTALDNNLQSYGKQGINTVAGVISKWAPPNENDTNGYIQEVSQRLGIKPNQPIDLSNPLVRQSISTAIALRENGPQGVFGTGGAGGRAPVAGPMAAQPPMGAQKSTETAQNAPSKQMQDSYNNLANSDSSYQQSRGALTDMLALAHQMGPVDSLVSKLPAEYHNINTPVTEYDKAHATFVSNQYNALSAGTDASKGTVNDMVPGSDKPQDAKIAGLNTQLNNLDYRHLETQFMTPVFQKGDQKGYTTLNAQFHNTIKPEMMPFINTLMGFQTKPQLAAGIAAITKQYPQYKKAIDFLGVNGMFDGVGQ